jgi:AcrR family transcriptional regulator
MNTDQETVVRSDGNEESAAKVGRGPGRPTRSNEELLDKALDLFLEYGFERTSIDAITASVGMAKRTVYMRYGDKTTLFRAALERAIKEWIVPVEQLRATETDDLEETLLQLGRTLVANIMTPAGLRLMRLTNAESVRMPEMGVYAYQEGTGPTLSYMADLFRRRLGPVAGEAADFDEAALAFLYLVVGGPASMTAWGLVLDQASIDHHTRYCVGLFLHGLLPKEPTARLPQVNGEVCAPPPQDVAALEDENRRLKKLLLDSMLELAALKEQSGGG